MKDRCKVWKHPGTSPIGFQCLKDHGHSGAHKYECDSPVNFQCAQQALLRIIGCLTDDIEALHNAKSDVLALSMTEFRDGLQRILDDLRERSNIPPSSG